MARSDYSEEERKNINKHFDEIERQVDALAYLSRGADFVQHFRDVLEDATEEVNDA